MGFNPFKAVKKVLKSDAGKLALGVGAFMYGPKLFGAEKIGLIKNKQLGPENAKTEQLHEHDANGSDGH